MKPLWPILLILLASCSVSYGDGRFKGAVACVNVSGLGFSWTCPETVQAPAIPNGQPIPAVPGK